MKKVYAKKKPDKERVTCEHCIHGKLVQYVQGNLKDPLLSECQLKDPEKRKEREPARWYSCSSAEKTNKTKLITYINKSNGHTRLDKAVPQDNIVGMVSRLSHGTPDAASEHERRTS